LETYIHDHAGTDFTHGICPACMKRVMNEEFGSQAEPIGTGV
jgi:hypothetical protein